MVAWLGQPPPIIARRAFMPFAPGIRWGVYEVVSLLGSGSMGEVYVLQRGEHAAGASNHARA
jgi:hypothetical protein